MSVEHGDSKKKIIITGSQNSYGPTRGPWDPRTVRNPEFVRWRLWDVNPESGIIIIRTIRTYWIPWDPRSGIITISVEWLYHHSTDSKNEFTSGPNLWFVRFVRDPWDPEFVRRPCGIPEIIIIRTIRTYWIPWDPELFQNSHDVSGTLIRNTE